MWDATIPHVVHRDAIASPKRLAVVVPLWGRYLRVAELHVVHGIWRLLPLEVLAGGSNAIVEPLSLYILPIFVGRRIPATLAAPIAVAILVAVAIAILAGTILAVSALTVPLGRWWRSLLLVLGEPGAG